MPGRLRGVSSAGRPRLRRLTFSRTPSIQYPRGRRGDRPRRADRNCSFCAAFRRPVARCTGPVDAVRLSDAAPVMGRFWHEAGSSSVICVTRENRATTFFRVQAAEFAHFVPVASQLEQRLRRFLHLRAVAVHLRRRGAASPDLHPSFRGSLSSPLRRLAAGMRLLPGS